MVILVFFYEISYMRNVDEALVVIVVALKVWVVKLAEVTRV